MSSHYDYSDDDSVDIRVQRFRRASPPRRAPVNTHYVQTVRERDIVRDRGRPAYYQAGPIATLQPERTVTTMRSHSHHRSRSQDRRASPPSAAAQAPVAPVVIQNKIYNDHSSDDDSYSDDSRSHHRHHRGGTHGARHRHRSRSRSRYSSGSSHHDDHIREQVVREHAELQLARRELDGLKIADDRRREEDRLRDKYQDEAELARARRRLEDIERQRQDEELERRFNEDATMRDAKRRLDEIEQKRRDEAVDRRYREDAELRDAKRKLDELKKREDRAAQEERIKKELELKALEEERRREHEKKRREKEKADAVAEWKAAEAERVEKERREKEAADKEYQRRLQEDLLRAGVDEKDIEAIMKKEKVKKEEEKKKKEALVSTEVARPTYTRMSLRHLDIETLIYHKIEFEYDQEPGYIVIKRWVPEWEQDQLWEHTRMIRISQKQRVTTDDRVIIKIDDNKKKHHHHHHRLEPEFEFVRKKERKRSKSPGGLLMYLAGAK